MIATFALALQMTNPISAQKWKFDCGFIGGIKMPLGENRELVEIRDPLCEGTLELSKEPSEDKSSDPFTLQLKIRRSQSPLVEYMANTIQNSKFGPKSDKDFIYVSDRYSLNKANLSVEHPSNNEFSQSEQILNPLAIGVGVMQRSMTDLKLKEEYFVMKDGPRSFFVTFDTNYNASTNESKGEAAYRFNVILKEDSKVYPKFFAGAVRVNKKTHIVEYIRATSFPQDGPLADEEGMGKDIKSFAINLVSKQ